MCVILKHIFMCLLFLPVTKIFKLFLDLNYYIEDLLYFF